LTCLLKITTRQWVQRRNFSMDDSLAHLLTEAKACTLCAAHLPLGPRPVFQVDARAKILISGQAPGTKVHQTGVPFDDASGERLRQWMGVDKHTFYDASQIAILPMGFCYPGRGKSGDLPPRPECADTWRKRFLAQMPDLKLTLVIGQYAQKWHLPDTHYKTLTELVKDWRSFSPSIIPLPHPSPRNNIWLKKNPWFAESLLPELSKRVGDTLV
jgi:uracil-DNA glycosylase